MAHGSCASFSFFSFELLIFLFQTFWIVETNQTVHLFYSYEKFMRALWERDGQNENWKENRKLRWQVSKDLTEYT